MSLGRRLTAVVILLLVALAAHGQSIVTVAGGGTDDGHAATDVGLFGVAGLAFDSAGNLYVTEQYANLVRTAARDTEADVIPSVARDRCGCVAR